MKIPSAMLAVAVLAGTVQVDFGDKTSILNGGENRVFDEDQRVPTVPTAKVTEKHLLAIGDFEKDLDGFQGAVQRDTTEAKMGKACAKLENTDKPWVEAGKEFVGLEQDFLELRFWVKARGAKVITMRLVDKAGQNYQQRFPIEPDGQWRLIIVKEFNKGQSWGGPADGKWHAPAKSITFVLEAKGTVWIDGVQATLDPALTSEATARRNLFAKAQRFVVGDFEQDLDGFQGAFQRDTAEAKRGKASAKLENKDKPWIEAAKVFTGLENDFLELRFWVKSRDVKTVTIRLVDKAGHNYQQRFPIQSDGAWQEIVIREFNKGQAWGGLPDGKWVGPPQSIVFVLEAKGTLWIDGIEALLSPNRSVEFFRVRPKVLGNVFLAGQPVEIPIETQAARLDCEVTDFWGKIVCKATAIPKDNLAVLRPDVKARGHFTACVRLLPADGGGPAAEHQIDFAVVEPMDLATLQASPFGAMTHFSVGWDTAIVPLIARAGLASVRDEAFWAGVEAEKDVFNFQRYDRYLAELKRHGIQPLIVLTFSNPHYDDGNTPYTVEACRATGADAQQVLKHYDQQVRWLEVWNEYNGSFCAGPATQDRPRYYTQMCKAAYQSIKEVRPDITVLGAAAVSIPLPYFESIFKQGGIDSMDAVVVHPYRGRPEGVEGEIAELRELIKKYNHDKEKPIWATEYGFGDKDPCEPARYLVRIAADALTERRTHVLVFDAGLQRVQGHGPDPRWRGPARALFAGAGLRRHGDHGAIVARCPLCQARGVRKYTRTYVLKFIRGAAGEEVRVCWATHPGKSASSRIARSPRMDLMGNAQPLATHEATALDVRRDPILPWWARRNESAGAGWHDHRGRPCRRLLQDPGGDWWYDGYSEDSGRLQAFPTRRDPWG